MNAHENGVPDDEQAFVHAPATPSWYWYCTEATPLPASAVVEASVTEPARLAAGEVIVTVGFVRSARVVTVPEVPVRPGVALSVAIARKS